MAAETLSGSFWFLFLYDVCDEIDLEALRGLVADSPARQSVRFKRPPVVESLEPVPLESGGSLRGQLQYYDYGVISVKWELPFSLSWDELIVRASYLPELPERQALAAETVRNRVSRIRKAMVRPKESWLDEEYYVIQLDSTGDAEALIADHGPKIAQIVRGENRALAGSECEEILRSRMSYYPADVFVVGWTAAILYDSAEGAAATLQLLEYANTQLLEFRHYDQELTKVLERVYQSLEKKRGVWARWRMGREARELNTILLEVRELTERADTAISFLSDMYSARQYRLAAERIGVGDYRRLVDSKLHTASDLYAFMMEQFHTSRAFALELMVVVILVIELAYLFNGKR